MPTPEMSDTTTHGVRVGATAFYLPAESSPDEGRYIFGYRIVIVNQSAETVRLLSRHWLIIDGEGQREEVRGPGVVGQQPTLKPGEGFKYVSGCPLGMPWGTMEGSYEFEREDGTRFQVEIGRFYLRTQPAEAGAT